MKKTIIILDIFLLAFILFVCVYRLFAQEPPQSAGKQVNPFSFLTIIKLDDVGSKEDIEKVKETLRTFGYKVHSHKINFERKEVLIRMRQLVSNDSLVVAFKTAGYKAWYDPKAEIRPGDAAYRESK